MCAQNVECSFYGCLDWQHKPVYFLMHTPDYGIKKNFSLFIAMPKVLFISRLFFDCFISLSFSLYHCFDVCVFVPLFKFSLKCQQLLHLNFFTHDAFSFILFFFFFCYSQNHLFYFYFFLLFL